MIPIKDFFQKKSSIIAIVSFIAIIAISLMKSAMELEDAEQAYYSQWLRLGYDDQPPFYTWLQYFINSIFGLSVVSFSLLRGAIFAFLVIATYYFSNAYLKDVSKANISLFALALVPVFIDFTFRRLSHTSLLCLAVVLTYYIIQNLITKKTIGNYLLFGFVVALGLLTKYNYVLVLGAIALTSLIDNDIRKVVFNKFILLSILIAGLCITPHFYWLFSNPEYMSALSSSVELKTMSDSSKGIPVITNVVTMLVTLLKVVAPIAIILLIFIGFKKVKFNFSNADWLVKLGLAQLLVVLLFFILMDVQKTEERWFLPLVIPFLPLLVKSFSFRSLKKWESFGFYLFLFLVFAQTIRTPIEKALHIPSDVHFGFEPISEVLNTQYSNAKWVLPNVTYAGNIRLLNKNREIYAADDFTLPVTEVNTNNRVKVFIEKESVKDQIPKDSIIDFGKRKQTIYFYK